MYGHAPATPGRLELRLTTPRSLPAAGILEAWAGMFNGLSKERAEQYLKPFAPPLLDFVEAIYADKAGQDDGACDAIWRALTGGSGRLPMSRGALVFGALPVNVLLRLAVCTEHAVLHKQRWPVGCWLGTQRRSRCAPPGPPTPPHSTPPHRAAGVWKASAALLGDVASTLSAVGVLFQQKQYVQPFLQQLAQDSTTADTANWASQMIQKALRG